MIKAVIFDRDGIIIDSESINILSAKEALKELGINLTKGDQEQIIGRHPEDYAQDFLKKYNFSYNQFKIIQRKDFYKLLERTKFFKKTLSLIRRLKKLKIPLALTTSSGIKSTSIILRRADLNDVFDIIVTDDDYKRRKPYPDCYILTAKKLGFQPKDCVAIEDSSVGLESAKRAGMKCIIIPNAYTKNQDFSKADLIVDSADKITIKLLQKL